ncbi:MAG: hypothetical protein Q8T11_09965 [Elusimicrobiota bacterium]|nr:hypothetical protein [Elusimicrobiota bacterium]
MKTAFILVVILGAACDSPKPPVPKAGTEPNKAVKYVGGLQTDVKLAEEAKAKAEAANKKAQEAETLPE